MPRRKIAADDPLQILAASTLRKQQKELEEAEAKERSRQQAIEQMHRTERDNALRRARFQAVCDHLAGSHRIGVVPRHKICALHRDELSNKRIRVYCTKCRFEWRPGDTADFIIRGIGPVEEGKTQKLPNPTRLGWRDVLKLHFSFEDAMERTSRAFRIEQVEPETIDSEEARLLKDQQIPTDIN